MKWSRLYSTPDIFQSARGTKVDERYTESPLSFLPRHVLTFSLRQCRMSTSITAAYAVPFQSFFSFISQHSVVHWVIFIVRRQCHLHPFMTFPLTTWVPESCREIILWGHGFICHLPLYVVHCWDENNEKWKWVLCFNLKYKSDFCICNTSWWQFLWVCRHFCFVFLLL